MGKLHVINVHLHKWPSLPPSPSLSLCVCVCVSLSLYIYICLVLSPLQMTISFSHDQKSSPTLLSHKIDPQLLLNHEIIFSLFIILFCWIFGEFKLDSWWFVFRCWIVWVWVIFVKSFSDLVWGLLMEI